MNSNRTGHRILALLFTFAGLLFLLTPASRGQAQENIANLNAPDVTGMAPSADDTQDPPTRVARISALEGSVSMQPGGAGDWGTATKNRPVTIGDKLWTDQGSRAELEAGQASIHVGNMTALSFLNLNQNVIQMRMAEGHLNFRVRELREGETYEVDTPNLAFVVTQAGAFRIDVNENGDYTSVTVIRGRGEVSVAGQSYPVNAGERGDVSGADQSVKFIPGTASEPDDLDRWAQERDLRQDNSGSARYVSRDTVGYGDLDDYGDWKDEPEVGHVWVPRNVPPDWAPYSDGNWSYVDPWGWTWVGYEPWGFAPYHYGRWNYYGGYWGWCPGPIWAPPVYGPAFVGFLGVGFGFGFGFGGGWGNAWFPLGWGEPYRPWYHCGGGYWNHINVYNTHINNTNITNINNYNYRYAHDPHAVTAASHNTFVNGQGINRNSTRLPASTLRDAKVAAGPTARPTNASYLGASSTHGRVATPSTAVQNRSVVARSTPAPAASHLPARTFASSGLAANHGGNAPAGNFNRGPASTSMPSINGARQSQPSANRPPTSFTPQGSRNIGTMNNNTSWPPASFNNSARPSTSLNNNANRPPTAFNNNTSRPAPRTWNAQGNTTDSGRAPQGFGNNNRPSTSLSARSYSDRPPSARNNSSGGSSAPQGRNNSVNRPLTSYSGGNRSYTPPPSNNRAPGNYNSPNRNYSAPRNYTPPSNRNYSSAPRSYTPPSNRNYSSAPRSYSAPHNYSAPRSYSAPAPRSYSAPHSSGGGNFGGSHGGGGGGGGSHGSGGGGGSHGSHH